MNQELKLTFILDYFKFIVNCLKIYNLLIYINSDIINNVLEETKEKNKKRKQIEREKNNFLKGKKLKYGRFSGDIYIQLFQFLFCYRKFYNF